MHGEIKLICLLTFFNNLLERKKQKAFNAASPLLLSYIWLYCLNEQNASLNNENSTCFSKNHYFFLEMFLFSG